MTARHWGSTATRDPEPAQANRDLLCVRHTDWQAICATREVQWRSHGMRQPRVSTRGNVPPNTNEPRSGGRCGSHPRVPTCRHSAASEFGFAGFLGLKSDAVACRHSAAQCSRSLLAGLARRHNGNRCTTNTYDISKPASVPVLVANLSVSNPKRCRTLTNRFGSG